MNRASLFFAAGFLTAIAIAAGYRRAEKASELRYERLAEKAYGEVSFEDEPEAESRSAPDGEMPEIPIDFSVLEAENEDIYAWIQIPGTAVDYPILQHGSDNGYYLRHTAFRQKDAAGSIYTEWMNAQDFSDKNTVIYGHNMANGSMFGGLRKYLDADYMRSHRDITIYTRERVYRYRIFAAVTYDSRHLLQSFDFDDRRQYQEFLDSLEQSRSLFSYRDPEIPVTADQRIITLSTCNGNDAERLLITAVLLPEQAAEDGLHYRKELRNILVMGIDKSEKLSLQDTPGTAGQADFILLVSLDRERGTGRLLQIPRSAMTQVDLYDVAGQYYTSVPAPIAAQYAYGDGGRGSSRAMMKSVSELLYGIPIDDYVTFYIAGLPILNDALGGVALTLSEDYREIDPAFIEGERLTLTGKQAERFVRYRDTAVTGSGLERMERQRQYMAALLPALRRGLTEKDGFAVLSEQVGDYAATDLEARQIEKLMEYRMDTEHIEAVPGSIRAGEVYDEFYVDEEALKGLLAEMFYEEGEDG